MAMARRPRHERRRQHRIQRHKKARRLGRRLLRSELNVIVTAFVSAPGNRNESPLLREALPLVSRIALAVGLTFKARLSVWMASTIAGGTGKPFSIAGWFPISTRTPAVEEAPNEAASHSSTLPFLRAIRYHRAGLWLGRQISPLVASVRSPQPAALRLQSAGLYDDQPAALLPGLILRPMPLHDGRIEPGSALRSTPILNYCAKYFRTNFVTPHFPEFPCSTNILIRCNENPQPVVQVDGRLLRTPTQWRASA